MKINIYSVTQISIWWTNGGLEFWPFWVPLGHGLDPLLYTI
jgi:hypothetical protein